MKTFNLDKFANKRTVVWNGKEHTITGLTLEAEINGNISERITNAETAKERLTALRDFITSASDFTEDEINKMNIEVLFALFKIAQGIDPDEKEDSGNTGTEGNASKE